MKNIELINNRVYISHNNKYYLLDTQSHRKVWAGGEVSENTYALFRVKQEHFYYTVHKNHITVETNKGYEKKILYYIYCRVI